MGVVSWDNSLRHRPESDAGNIALTPTWLVDRIRADVFGGRIDLDPATTPENPVGAERFIALPEDGILTPWSGPHIFCNPPYGSTLPHWVEKCIQNASTAKIVLLIPARVETRWFQLALRNASDTLFFSKRLQFGKWGAFGGRAGRNAPFPSVLFAFGADLAPLADLGLRIRTIS